MHGYQQGKGKQYQLKDLRRSLLKEDDGLRNEESLDCGRNVKQFPVVSESPGQYQLLHFAYEPTLQQSHRQQKYQQTHPYTQPQSPNLLQNIRTSHHSYTTFRQSFTTDNTESTIYLQPPQFILRSPLLLYLMNKLIQEFFDLTQCIGIVAVKVFRMMVYLVLVFVCGNVSILLYDWAYFDGTITNTELTNQTISFPLQCLHNDNSGIIELSKWLQLDTIASILIILLLWMNKFLMQNYSHSYFNHRHNTNNNNRSLHYKHIKHLIHFVQCSWVTLYCVKFFVLNSIGSCQFFTYTYNRGNGDNSNRVEGSGVANSSVGNDDNSRFTVTQCPQLLNIYLMSLIVFNYVSVVFICVYAVEHLV